MRIVDCLTNAHNLALVALAALICVLGSWITVSLLKRVRSTRTGTRAAWVFLGSVAGGATVWCTHFVAMIAYEPGVQVTYEPGLTGLSLFVAIAGSGAALMMGAQRFNGAALVGGVETAEQLAFLRAQGCNEVQGYLLGRPQPEADALSNGAAVVANLPDAQLAEVRAAA